MLFLTATPFQLGHHELVSVLRRFGDVRWDASVLGERDKFIDQMDGLRDCLNESQRTAIALQRSWSRLSDEDWDDEVQDWWKRISAAPRESLTHRQRAVVDANQSARVARDAAQQALRPWVVRHNKGVHWNDTVISRRERLDGSAVNGGGVPCGLPVPQEQLLPFFLAARSAVSAGQGLLGEALCSSYEAFRFTRKNRDHGKDDQDAALTAMVEMTHSRWYLQEFDRALSQCSGATHPKISSTVQRVVDLWEAGEKVLVFAFYRQTCRALRIHISGEIEKRLFEAARRRLVEAGQVTTLDGVGEVLERIQKRYFDDSDSPGRRAIDDVLGQIIQSHAAALASAQATKEQRTTLIEVMRRFLRVSTTLARCFPLANLDSAKPDDAVAIMMGHQDASGLSWRQKFDGFITFLTECCSSDERHNFLAAARDVSTATRRVTSLENSNDEEDVVDPDLIPCVREITGKTTPREARARLMRAFDTPFFPDILVCSQVMGEGVDLQRFCRHVIHHDLDWNPSTIEQRTGRVDRLGCKAEGLHPIKVYLPYLAGTADERQYKVMSDRERWFRVVMGQDEVARLITPESNSGVPLPDVISEELSFKLGIGGFES